MQPIEIKSSTLLIILSLVRDSLATSSHYDKMQVHKYENIWQGSNAIHTMPDKQPGWFRQRDWERIKDETLIGKLKQATPRDLSGYSLLYSWKSESHGVQTEIISVYQQQNDFRWKKRDWDSTGNYPADQVRDIHVVSNDYGAPAATGGYSWYKLNWPRRIGGPISIENFYKRHQTNFRDQHSSTNGKTVKKTSGLLWPLIVAVGTIVGAIAIPTFKGYLSASTAQEGGSYHDVDIEAEEDEDSIPLPLILFCIATILMVVTAFLIFHYRRRRANEERNDIMGSRAVNSGNDRNLEVVVDAEKECVDGDQGDSVSIPVAGKEVVDGPPSEHSYLRIASRRKRKGRISKSCNGYCVDLE